MAEIGLRLDLVAKMMEQLSSEDQTELLESLLVAIVENPDGVSRILEEYVLGWRFEQAVGRLESRGERGGKP